MLSVAVRPPLAASKVSVQQGLPVLRVDHADLTVAKDKVGEVKVRHGEDAWRTAVNFVDPYAALPLQVRVPSRAYFKWVEMAETIPKPSNILHLCEAPGGFVQANWDMFRTPWVAHSLKCSIRFKRMPPGGRVWEEGDGDLLDDATFDRMRGKLCNDFDCVTADGSVDFESEHSRVEECNFHLLLRQCILARFALRPGGSLVVKVFDVTTECTWGVVQLLAQWFDKVRIVKPASSRASNGECYAVCTGLKEGLDPPFHPPDPSTRVCRLFSCIDDGVASDLTASVFATSQLKAIRSAIALCSGKQTRSVDKTKEWWDGPGRHVAEAIERRNADGAKRQKSF